MIQLQAAQEDVKQALRSVSAEREKEQCLRFREALKNEAQRFDFREALQGELSCWRPRDTWPFPALPSAAVDVVAELRHVTGSGVPPGPSIKALEAAARKLQSMFRWRKLWVQLDTSKERQAAAKKIQALQRGRQVRKGLAAQFAETASNGTLEPVEEVDPVVSEPVVEVLADMPSTQVKLEVDTELTRSLSFEASEMGQWPASSLELPVQKLPSVQSKTSEDEDKVQLYGPGTEVPAQTAPSQAAMLGFFDSPEVEAAAIRIQAVERGRQQRKQLKMMEKTTEVMDVVDVEVPSVLEDSSGLEAFWTPPAETWSEPMSFMTSASPEETVGHQDPEPTLTTFTETTLMTPVTPEDPQVDAPSKAPDTPSFSESPRRRPEGRSSSAKERTNRFRMAPVNFERLEESPIDAPDSGHIGSPGRHSNDEVVPKTTTEFLGGGDVTAPSSLVSRLKLPKAKKSPRSKEKQRGVIPRPVVTAMEDFPKEAVEVDSSWLGTGTMEASTISGAAGSDPFGSAGPTVGISTSGFRLPKGKEERDDSKARKKKKKKKEKKEDDLDDFGFQLF